MRQILETKAAAKKQQLWRKILEQESPRTIRSSREAKLRTREGVPPELRPCVYKYLCVYTPRLKEECQQQSHDQIRMDLHRTGDKPTALELKHFQRVLVSLAGHYPEVGYCQGMNYWVYRLTDMLGEDHGWRVAFNLMKIPELRLSYVAPERIHLTNFVLRGLLEDIAPAIMLRLEELGIELVYFTPSWFMTLFAKVLGTQPFLRLLDSLLFEGYKVMFRAALALLLLLRKDILKGEAQSVLMLLQGQLEVDQQQFSEAMFSLSFSRRRLQQLSSQFLSQ